MPNTTPLDIPSLLRRIPLFSELSEADIQLVARYTRERQVAHVAAPAARGAFGALRLPDRLLVVVREQLGRQRHSAA